MGSVLRVKNTVAFPGFTVNIRLSPTRLALLAITRPCASTTWMNDVSWEAIWSGCASVPLLAMVDTDANSSRSAWSTLLNWVWLSSATSKMPARLNAAARTTTADKTVLAFTETAHRNGPRGFLWLTPFSTLLKVTFLQSIAGTRDGHNRFGAERPVDLSPQVSHVNFDDVRVAVILWVPDVIEYL